MLNALYDFLCELSQGLNFRFQVAMHIAVFAAKGYVDRPSKLSVICRLNHSGQSVLHATICTYDSTKLYCCQSIDK